MEVVVYSMFGFESDAHSSAILAKELKRNLLSRNHEVTSFTSKDIVSGCVGCKRCTDGSHCAISDAFQIPSTAPIFLVSPVYFFGLPAQTKAFLDRLYSVSLIGRIIAPILTSGSQFYEGGVDLIIQQFERIDAYCGSVTVSPYNKVTFDEVLPLTYQDTLAISDIVARVEVLYGSEC